MSACLRVGRKGGSLGGVHRVPKIWGVGDVGVQVRKLWDEAG